MTRADGLARAALWGVILGLVGWAGARAGAAAILGCTPSPAAVSTATEIAKDTALEVACQAQGLAALDAGKPSPFGVYCACTVDAGLRASCAGVSP
jgi:hypothetical protein